jgi:MFS family permease
MERLHDAMGSEVHLSKEAQDVLYQHGNQHKKGFEKALGSTSSRLLLERIADRRGPHFVIGLASVILIVSWVVFGVWGKVAGLISGVVLLDFGAQGSQVSNQHVTQALRPEARGRLNAVLMGGMFLGGAVGSATASLAWDFAGWTPVCILGAVFAAMAWVYIPAVVDRWEEPTEHFGVGTWNKLGGHGHTLATIRRRALYGPALADFGSNSY